jgi:hypothetical protein
MFQFLHIYDPCFSFIHSFFFSSSLMVFLYSPSNVIPLLLSLTCLPFCSKFAACSHSPSNQLLYFSISTLPRTVNSNICYCISEVLPGSTNILTTMDTCQALAQLVLTRATRRNIPEDTILLIWLQVPVPCFLR